MRKGPDIILNLCKGLDAIGGTVLVLMMLVTVADVILRYLGYPIFGTYDMITFGAVLVISCAMPRTALEKTHTLVDILLEKISPGKGRVLFVFTRILNILLFLLFAWSLFDVARTAVKTGEMSLLLNIPAYIAPGVLALCCLIEGFVHLGDIVKTISQSGDNDE